MHPNPRRVAPVVVVLVLLGVGYWYFFGGGRVARTGAITASGTIEATQINISPELGGRIGAVYVSEGDEIKAGDVLIQFDTSLLLAQRAQAAAALEAARANYELLESGPTTNPGRAQVARAEAEFHQAQQALDDLLSSAEVTRAEAQLAVAQAVETLANAERDLASVQQSEIAASRVAVARAKLARARKLLEDVSAGPDPDVLAAAQARVAAAEAAWQAAKEGAGPAQLKAAQAQVEAAQAALAALDVQIAKMTITAPIGGVVLTRAVEPGEVAGPGGTLLVIGDLDHLTLTVYVPEDLYGTIRLGQTAAVLVDSYPGETFEATVTHIADRAEFTPRNVQTAAGRKTTVFAVQLTLENVEGKLKPGMPGDVKFGE